MDIIEAAANYPVGFIIAPVFIYPGWQEEYYDLLQSLKAQLPESLKHPVIFEVISHRYTLRAKGRIEQIFPETTLPMTEEDRQFKYGQFGYGKYVYPKDQMAEIKNFFKKSLEELFPYKDLKYII